VVMAHGGAASAAVVHYGCCEWRREEWACGGARCSSDRGVGVAGHHPRWPITGGHAVRTMWSKAGLALHAREGKVEWAWAVWALLGRKKGADPVLVSSSLFFF
jgi:hypothetical protein